MKRESAWWSMIFHVSDLREQSPVSPADRAKPEMPPGPPAVRQRSYRPGAQQGCSKALPCLSRWASGLRTKVLLWEHLTPWEMYRCFLPLTQLTLISPTVRLGKYLQTLISPRNWHLHLLFTVIHLQENQHYWSFPFCRCNFRAHLHDNVASQFLFPSHWLQELSQRDHGYLNLTPRYKSKWSPVISRLACPSFQKLFL